MAQSSAPIVGVNLSDVNWRDLFGDEPGVVGDLDGSAYAVTLPPDSEVAQIGSATQPSLARVAGFSHRIPAGQPEGVTIPSASGSARTDLIVLRYDPAHTGAPGPVRLVRIPGTSTGLPVYDAAPPGVEDLPLWSVTRQPGQALSQATVRRVFPRVGPSLLLDAGAPLPLSSPLGTRLRQGGANYTRVSDGSGVPVWSPDFQGGALCRPVPLRGDTGVGGGFLPLGSTPVLNVPAGRQLNIRATFHVYVVGGAGGLLRVGVERWQGVSMGALDFREYPITSSPQLIAVDLDSVDSPPGPCFYKVAATCTSNPSTKYVDLALVGDRARAAQMYVVDQGPRPPAA